MVIDMTSPRTRRALLTAAVGGTAAATVATITKVSPLEAANGDTVKVGAEHEGASETSFKNTTAGLAALSGEASGGGRGISGVGKSGAKGVVGQATGVGGVGVEGLGSGAAVGVSATSTGSSHALVVDFGRISINQVSGVATIKKGKKSVTVKPGVDINGKTFVLLTPKTNIGSRALWYSTSNSTDKITIRMSSTRGRATKIAWLALENG